MRNFTLRKVTNCVLTTYVKKQYKEQPRQKKHAWLVRVRISPHVKDMQRVLDL